MSWPQGVDYNEAIQNPLVCFRDPELRQGVAWRNDLGMPTPHSGNLADVYRMDGPGGAAWAVKCFTRPVHGLQARYQAVSDHLRAVSRSFFVEFQYLEGGIRVATTWYPVVKMRWIEGFTLNQFVADHTDDTELLTKLSHLWMRLVREMREVGVAHGDLQHGNILLVPGSRDGKLALRLVDYDGLCVPALAAKPSDEFGHANYQHPGRKHAGYGLEMDRFAALVILTGLRATAAGGKGLWRRFDRGENLLFRESDYVEPAESDLLKKLWLEFGGEVRILVGRLVLALSGPIEAVPRLDELIDHDAVRPLTRDEECRVADTLKLPPPPQASARPASKPQISLPSTRATPIPATKRPTAEAIPVPQPILMDAPKIPPPTADQRRAAAGQFERANQVIATGNYEYGLKLLFACCTLDRANLIYRQALRRTEKAKYKNNLRGAWHAWLTTWPTKARLKAALRGGDPIKALDLGEKVLLRNPWDIGAQMDMARAAEELGFLDLALWSLEQARQKTPDDPTVNRALALLFERRGNFTQAMALWALVRKARPGDPDADQKLKDLAVHDTIRRGNYAETAANAVASRAGGAASTEETPVVASERVAPAPSPSHESSTVGVLRRRIHDAPTEPRGYLQLARHLRQTGNVEGARAALTEGMGPTGNAFELLVELTDLDIEPFRHDLAVTEAKLANHPANPELVGLRNRLAKEINTRELDLYRRKADRFPTDVGNRVEVGIRLLRIGQIDEAIRELQGARTDPRQGGRAAYHLGHCFMARNNARLALRNFEEALEHLSPADGDLRKEVRYYLAQTLASLGELARAVDVGNDLAHEDYGYRDIASLLDDWQERVQRVEQAGQLALPQGRWRW